MFTGVFSIVVVTSVKCLDSLSGLMIDDMRGVSTEMSLWCHAVQHQWHFPLPWLTVWVTAGYENLYKLATLSPDILTGWIWSDDMNPVYSTYMCMKISKTVSVSKHAQSAKCPFSKVGRAFRSLYVGSKPSTYEKFEPEGWNVLDPDWPQISPKAEEETMVAGIPPYRNENVSAHSLVLFQLWK